LCYLTGVAAVEPSAAKAVVEAFVAKLTALEATITTAQVTAYCYDYCYCWTTAATIVIKIVEVMR
jgi:hypothetical protein